MELAVLGLLGGADAGSDVGLEAIEAEGDNLPGISELASRMRFRVGAAQLTVLSGEMLVDTDPCGHPFPEKLTL